ncbi:MAG: carbamate kinase [Parvibaculaceae bacterium]
MRLVIALGGNALLRRGEPMSAEVQRRNIRTAAAVLAPVVEKHSVIVTHGNGPQVGLLALQAAALKTVPAYPLDVLGAESEGMIGYLLEQELGNVLRPGSLVATLLTQIEVDPGDPAFEAPTKPIGPVYSQEEAEIIGRHHSWTMARDGGKFRRVVPSPAPRSLIELRTIEILLASRVTVICAGGGGIPVVKTAGGGLSGVEAVIDKDWASELVARLLGADGLVMLTDVAAVELDHGSARARRIRTANPSSLSSLAFDAGSMGPKVGAGCAFAARTGGFAAIGALPELQDILAGEAGTHISSRHAGITLARAAG